MKVVVKTKESKISYPCLGEYEDGTIVLFISEFEGICLKAGTSANYVGQHSDGWSGKWRLFEGTLELSNDCE